MTPEVRFGTASTYLDLMNRTTYRVRPPGINAPEAATNVRAVTVPLLLSATTPDGLGAAKSALEDMLTLARRTLRERDNATDRVALAVRAGATDWTYIDVLSGTVDGWEALPDGIHAYATLTLACRPLFRGDMMQAQNLLSAPTDPTVAAWTKTNATATASNTTAPDGSGTGGTLLETTATGAHGISQSVTKPATATQYAASVYVKANGRSRVRLSLMSGANGARATFDLSAGTISTAAALVGSGWAGASATIVADGDWWRVSIAATSDTTTTATVALELDNGSGTSYAGDVAKGVRVWGAQLEEGAEPGLLLVASYLPDSVQAAWTESGYEYDEPSGSFNYTADPDNLVSRSDFTSSNMTRQASYSDPSGGTSAERFVDNSVASSVRYVSSQGDPTPSSLPRNYTGAIYVKNYAGRNTPTIVFRESGGDSVYFEVNMTDGTMGSVTTAGSKVTLVSREVQAVASSWYWVRITATIGSGAGDLEFRIYPNGTAAYAGTTTYGVIVWRPQIVTGDTIDDPQILTTVVVDPIEHAAVTVGAGRQSGAWVYGIPGDAPALYRAELDDNSATVAVNRVHIGAWSGPGVLLDEVEPFSIAAASDAAAMVSDGSGNIGTSYPTMGADLDWSAVGSVSLTDLTSRRGSADVIARVKDGSSYLSQPQSLEASVTGGIYARRISRIYRDASTGMGFGAPRVTPGSTLVMLVQWTALIGAGTPTMSGTGGLTWTKIGQVEEGFSRFAWWYAKDVTQPTSQIAVTWAGTAGFPAATLVEIIGAAADPFDKWAGASVSSRYHNTSYSATLGSATAQAHSLLLSAGLGLGIANNPLTVPSGYWRVVSSLSSGGVGALTVTSTGAYGVTWDRPPGIVDSGEGWIVAIAAFKAAAATGSSITVGQWQNCVTAVDAAGNESLPTGVVSVPVPSTSSAVALTWTPPATGTPTKYRVYRQHVDTWAYVEVTAPATSYIWTSESVYTNAMPPTVAPPVAAWRAAVSLPSGETLWRSQASASSNLASGLWEDISLGSLPLPPIASGEGVTPDEARLTVEAAHLTGAIVGVNGIWLVDSAEGQTVSHRIGMAADAPADWVVDTNRDGVTSAWLRDPTTGDEAGQLAIRGQQTLSPGNAQIVVRPEVAAGESDMVAGNLSIRRLLITPRWRYLRGID